MRAINTDTFTRTLLCYNSTIASCCAVQFNLTIPVNFTSNMKPFLNLVHNYSSDLNYIFSPEVSLTNGKIIHNNIVCISTTFCLNSQET